MTWFKLRWKSLTGAWRGRVALVAALMVPALAVLVLALGVAPALDRTDRIPVAVVNQDTGSEGSALVDDLFDTAELAWSAVSERDALAGLEDGAFALALVIPKDYSQQVASVSTDEPEKAVLELVSDGGGNVLATRAGSAVMRQVQARLKARIGEDYLLSVLNDVRGQATRLTVTADGSTMLDQGFQALSSGADTIAAGLDRVSEGAGQLSDGLSQTALGAQAAGTGAQALASGLSTVRERAVAPLSQGAQALASGLSATADAAQALGQGVEGASRLVEAATAATERGMTGVAGLAGAERSLARDGQTLAAALTRANVALGAAGAAMDGVTAAVGDAARSDAGAVASGLDRLAGSLSSGAADAPGYAQRAGSIADAVDGSAQTVAAFLASDAGHALSSEQREALQGAVDGLHSSSADARVLASGLGDTAREASGLAATASDVSTGITAAQGSADALAAARAELAQAQADVARAAAGMGNSIDGARVDAQTASSALATVHAILSGQATAAQTGGAAVPLASTLSSLGGGVSAIGVQLGQEGAVGQGAQGLARGTAALGQALAPLAQAASGISTGVTALGEALSGVGAGASGLGSGVSAMATATRQLGEGAGTLGSATSQVVDAVAKSGDALANISSAREERAQVASSAVTVTAVREHGVEGSVGSLSPAIAALALGAGAVLSLALLPAVDSRAVLAGRLVRAVAEPFACYALLGMIQALFAGALLTVLGVRPGNPAAFWGLLVLGGISLGAQAQLLHLALGRRAGIAAGVLLWALQVACGGVILPAALAGGVLAALGDVLPVPLLARGLSGAVAGSLAGVAPAAAALTGLAVLSLVLTGLIAALRRFPLGVRALAVR